MEIFRSILSNLEDVLQVGPLNIDENGYIQLCFEGDLIVLIKLESSTLTLFSRIGEAPENNADFAEELLTSNLFWRDTSGATISLERYSRDIILAKQFSFLAIQDKEIFIQEIQTFIEMCNKWMLAIPLLIEQTEVNNQNSYKNIINYSNGSHLIP